MELYFDLLLESYMDGIDLVYVSPGKDFSQHIILGYEGHWLQFEHTQHLNPTYSSTSCVWIDDTVS